MNGHVLTFVVCCCVCLSQLTEARPETRAASSLVDVIKQIDATRFFAILTPEEQTSIIQIVLAGQNRTLAQYIQKVGYATVLQILEKLPETYAKEITGFIINGLTTEAIPSGNGVGQASSSA